MAELKIISMDEVRGRSGNGSASLVIHWKTDHYSRYAARENHFVLSLAAPLSRRKAPCDSNGARANRYFIRPQRTDWETRSKPRLLADNADCSKSKS